MTRTRAQLLQHYHLKCLAIGRSGTPWAIALADDHPNAIS
jgi:hypothetical protein